MFRLGAIQLQRRVLLLRFFRLFELMQRVLWVILLRRCLRARSRTEGSELVPTRPFRLLWEQ